MIYSPYNIPDDLVKLTRLDFNNIRELIESYRTTFIETVRFRDALQYWEVEAQTGRFLINYHYREEGARSVYFDEIYAHIVQHRASRGVAVQLSLGVLPPIRPIERREQEESIAEQFQRFHVTNPHVYRKIREIAFWCLDHNKRMGIGAIYEALRWQFGLQTESEDGYKLNNNYRSHYSRLLMEQEPDLQGFFQVRELQS